MRRWMLACSIAGALLAGGCLHSRVDEEWGEAYEDDTAAQVADPDGAGSPDGPRGVGAVTSEEIANRYYKDQVLQPPRHGGGPVLEQSP